MSEYKDIFGIGDKPVQSEPVRDERMGDEVLSLFGVPRKEKKEEE